MMKVFIDIDKEDNIYIYGQNTGYIQPSNNVYSVNNSRQFIQN